MQFRRHAIVGLSVAVLAIAAPAFAQEPISDSDRLELGIRMLTNDTDADDAEAVATLNLITDERLKALANWPLGRAYLFGQGVPQDLTRGGRMMALAVEAAPDNTDARFLLARSRQQGWACLLIRPRLSGISGSPPNRAILARNGTSAWRC